MRGLLRYQLWHLLLLVVLIVSVRVYIQNDPDATAGELWGIRTLVWLWVAVAVPVVHQVYVWLVWRLELYHRTFTSRWGMQAFKVYSAGFSILFTGRLILIVLLAYSNRDSLSVMPILAYLAAAVITPMVLYLFYSVIRYFTMERAYGIDHFDKDYLEPYVKNGIFRYTDNGMYVYGFLVFYLPGLLLLSKGALIVALFNHAYIWVHYYCTERPDMKKIYGNPPGA